MARLQVLEKSVREALADKQCSVERVNYSDGGERLRFVCSRDDTHRYIEVRRIDDGDSWEFYVLFGEYGDDVIGTDGKRGGDLDYVVRLATHWLGDWGALESVPYE